LANFVKGFFNSGYTSTTFNSGVGVFFSRQDAGLLPANLTAATALHFTAGYLKLSLQQEPRPCFAFLGGNSPLPIRSTGAIILS
jgi:hypothetical protein